MAIYSELGAGQRLYLDNQGDRTIVTLATTGAGQQQQSSTGLQTGVWTEEPKIYRTPTGAIAAITTATGNYSIEIQGSSIQLTTRTPSPTTEIPATRTEESPAGFTMEPMPPMQPMKMGDTSMSFQPMRMRMGNMSMSMDTGEQPKAVRQFCSQCGSKVAESDRFCSHCGHRLS
jgi:hypothetical protein